MAKLKHLQELLARVGGVTPARANVWVMSARKAGHFTTGGRGVNAPNISSRDVANGLLLAMQFNPPTEAAEAIPMLRSLPFFIVSHDPGDGTYRDIDNPDVIKENLPPAFNSFAEIINLGSALDTVFAAKSGTIFENPFDLIQHMTRDGKSSVSLEIADSDYFRNAWAEGPKAWKFIFEEPDFGTDSGGFGTRTTKTIHREALRALLGLASVETSTAIHDPDA